MTGPTGEPVVQFEHVTVAFDEVAALVDVTLELREGDTCVVLGASGSGKTVLLKTALGLVLPDAGRVLLFGEDIRQVTQARLMELRSRMGVLFQEGGLFDSLTIEENVAYPLVNQAALHCPPDAVLPRVQEALDFVELGHTLEKVPSELSGGMRRRVGIARAIVTAPELILYDSPTAGLDPITATTIMALIAKGRDTRAITSALATHRYQDGHLLANYRYNAGRGELERARHNGGPQTRFLVLREGRLVFDGSEEELEASTDPYIAMFVKRLSE